MHPPVVGRPDKWIWTLESSGSYSTKSMYRELTPPFDPVTSPLSLISWKHLWRLKVHARLRLLLWKLAWNLLPTRARIAAAIFQQVPDGASCFLCNEGVDSASHLFLSCPVSCIIWRESPWQVSLSLHVGGSVFDWISIILEPSVLGIPRGEMHHFQLFALNAIDVVWFQESH